MQDTYRPNIYELKVISRRPGLTAVVYEPPIDEFLNTLVGKGLLPKKLVKYEIRDEDGIKTIEFLTETGQLDLEDLFKVWLAGRQ